MLNSNMNGKRKNLKSRLLTPVPLHSDPGAKSVANCPTKDCYCATDMVSILGHQIRFLSRMVLRKPSRRSGTASLALPTARRKANVACIVCVTHAGHAIYHLDINLFVSHIGYVHLWY